MDISMNDLEALVSKGARQLSQPNSKAQKRTAQPVNEDAMVGQGDAFLESLGYDEYDNYDDVSTTPSQEKVQYASRKLNESELASAANFNVSPEAMQKSKLPSAIKNLVAESISNETVATPINEDQFAKIRRIMKESDELTSTNGIVKKKPVAQPIGIDYAMIKEIVAECLREQQQEMLNENALKAINIKAGVISLIDNSGNIFRAKLEKVGNKNDKK